MYYMLLELEENFKKGHTAKLSAKGGVGFKPCQVTKQLIG
jgi:hypothetical protein